MFRSWAEALEEMVENSSNIECNRKAKSVRDPIQSVRAPGSQHGKPEEINNC